MPNEKPFVSAAFVCEKVLIEKDGVLSAVRMVDIFFVSPVPPDLPPNMKPSIDVTLLVCLKSGDVKGTYDVKLKLRTATGKTIDVGSQAMILNGGETGANWVVQLQMPGNQMGLYWFDLYWQDEVLTSVPLKLAPAPQPAVETQETG